MADGEALAAQAGLPWPPGEAADLQAAARRLAMAAGDVAHVAAQLGGLDAAGAGWHGLAAGRFDASADAEVAALAQAGDGLDAAARGLGELAEAVTDAQEEVTRLARRVVEHEEQVARAARLAPWAVVGAPLLGDGDAAARVAARLEAELIALRRRASGLAEDACDRARRADRRCAMTLSALVCQAPLPGEVGPTLPATPLALAVAVAYSPDYLFHREEDHFPMDPRAWIANADLRDRDGQAYLDPRGEDVRKGDLAHAALPFAYHVTADGDVQLEYGTFYAFNDFPDDLGVSDHEGDFEPVTVQLDAGGQPSKVDFEAHGHTGAVDWDSTHRRGLHPQVYVTHGGHGNHPGPGRYESDFSDGRDLVGNHWEDKADGRDEGRSWDTGGDVFDARSVPQLRDDIRFGEDKGDGNPLPFLHPDQGPPDDLDDPDAPSHATHADGVEDAAVDWLRGLAGGRP